MQWRAHEFSSSCLAGFVGEKMTFLERVLVLEELLHSNKCYLECIQ